MWNFKSVSATLSFVAVCLAASLSQGIDICDSQGLNCVTYLECAIDIDGDGVPAMNATHHILQLSFCPQKPGTFLSNVQTYSISSGPNPTASTTNMPVVSAYFTDQTSKFMFPAFGARDVNGDGTINDRGVLVNNVLTFDTIDCNDNNAAISPRKTEVSSNLVDDDCNGLIDEHKFLAVEPTPRAYSTGLQKAATDFKIQINQAAQLIYLSNSKSNPKFKYELTAFSYNNTAAVQTATFTQNTAGSLSGSVLTIYSPQIFNKGEVYNIKIALKDVAGNPLGGYSVQSASQVGNQDHLILGGSGLAGTIYFFRTLFLTKTFNERLAFLKGEVGKAGSIYANGSKYNTGSLDDEWCDQLPKWIGQETSKTFNGGTSPFWNLVQTTFFEDAFQDPLMDGECIKNPNAPLGCIGEDRVNGTCDCSQANLDNGYIDSTSLDAYDSSFYDDGKGKYSQFYYSSTQPLMTRAVPGDVLHHTGYTHFATFIGYDQVANPPVVYTVDSNVPTHGITIQGRPIDTSILEYPLDPDKRQYWAEIESITEFTK